MWPDPNDEICNQLGYICMLNEFFNKGRFLFMTEDGRFEMTTMKEGDLVAYGRCPSQGVDSALPMRVRRANEGNLSTRVPLDVCKLNNTDFGGNEAWMYKVAFADAIKEMEMEMAWDRIWSGGAQEHLLHRGRQLLVPPHTVP